MADEGARVALYAVLEPLQIREAVGPSGAGENALEWAERLERVASS